MNQTLTADLFSILNTEMDVLPAELYTLPARTCTDNILLHVALLHKIFTRWPDRFYSFLDLFHRLVKATYGHGYFAKACHYLFFHSLNAPAFDPIVQAFRAYDRALWLGTERQSDTIKQEAAP